MTKKRSAFGKNLAPTSKVKASQKVINDDPLKHSTFLLPVSQKQWLEDLSYTAKRTGGTRITQATIVRLLIQTAKDKGLDTTGITSEEALQERINSFFK